MSLQHIYVAEKLREIQMIQAAQRPPDGEPPRKAKPVIGPVARRAGRALRRFGEGLESWGAPPPQPERQQGAQY